MPRQDSLYEQLKDVRQAAVKMGAYDAADFISQELAKIAKRQQDKPAPTQEQPEPPSPTV